MTTCGYYHTCVITENGKIWTCGSGTCGQLGHGTREHHLVPRSITNTNEPKKIDRFAKCLPTEEVTQIEGRERERREKERERREKEREKERERERERLEYGTVLVAAGKLTSAISRTTSSISRTTSSISGTTRSDSKKERTSAIASCNASAGALPFWGALVLDVAAGPRDTVAVCSDGSLWSWGGGSEGQLGHGDMPKWRLTPLRIGREKFGGVPVVMADAGDNHSIAVCADGGVWAWGNGRDAQLGTEDRFSHLVPERVAAEHFGHFRIVFVAAGDDHTIALTSLCDVFTWGRGRFGRLGHNDELDRLAPKQVPRESLQNSPAVLVAAGKLTSAAVASDGSLFVWGWGQWGQLGVGDNVNRLTPVRLTPEKDFEDSRVLVTSCGGFHMLAVSEYGAVWSWGRGAQAQLGHNDRHDCLVPRSIEMKRFDDLKVVTVACGLLHSVAVTEDGRLWTWGSALSTGHELAKETEGYQEIPTGLGHPDMQDKLEPTAVQTLVEADARVMRCRRPLPSNHAVAYAMQSRMVLDDECTYEVCMHQLVAQAVELEDEIVRKRRELRQKRRDLQERLLKSRERTTQLLLQIQQEQGILTKWQDEEVALGASLMKNEEMKGMSMREMALHTAKLSAEISRQEKIVKEIASELDTTRLDIVHATEELVQTEELISKREEREGEEGRALEMVVRVLLGGAWCVCLRSSFLAPMSPEERCACLESVGEASDLGGYLAGLTLEERTVFLSNVNDKARHVFLEAESVYMERQRELEMQQRRMRELEAIAASERRAARCAGASLQKLVSDLEIEEEELSRLMNSAESLSGPESCMLEEVLQLAARREREADEKAGWVGIYRGGSVPAPPLEGEEVLELPGREWVLYVAAKHGHSSVTKQLLALRCNVDLQTEKGFTPLHVAAQNGHASITEQLIAARCNVDLQEENGCSPLHLAVKQGDSSVTKQLLAARCNVDLQNKDCATPLYVAAEHGHVIVTKKLLASRCNLDLQIKDGITALEVAERQGHAEIAYLIVKRKQRDAEKLLEHLIKLVQEQGEKVRKIKLEPAWHTTNELQEALDSLHLKEHLLSLAHLQGEQVRKIKLDPESYTRAEYDKAFHNFLAKLKELKAKADDPRKALQEDIKLHKEPEDG